MTALRTDSPGPGAHPTAPTTGPEGYAELEAALQDALEVDRRVGTVTGLLLVGGPCPPALLRRMRSAVRARDQWVALPPAEGGELHAVLLTGLPPAGSEGAVDRAADALLHAVESAPHGGPGTGTSIGASLAPSRAATAPEAIVQAAAALRAAQRAGGRCARIRGV